MAQDLQLSPEQCEQKLARLIEGIDTVMLTTTDADGALHSRPMAVPEHGFDGDLWFVTSATSGKTSEIGHDSHVNLAFSEPEGHRYVSVAGRAEIVRDPAKARALWQPAMRAFYPHGPEDPDLVLLRVRPQSVQYWDLRERRLVRLVGFVRALATGQKWQGVPSHQLQFLA